MDVNELSYATFTVIPRNTSGVATEPTNCRYRLDDLTSGNSIIAWTDVDELSTSMTIEIAASNNSIIDTNVDSEIKVLTVETDYGTDDAHIEELSYEVINLSFAS